MRFGDGRPAVRRQPGVRPVRRGPGHRLEDEPERDAHDREGQLDLHQRRADRRRRRLVGGDDRRAAGAPDRLEGPRLDAGLRRAVVAPELPVLHPDQAVPDHRAEYEDPNGVPISAIFFGGRRATHDPAGDRGAGLDHGVFMGATLSSRDHRRRDRRGRRRAARPDGDAAVHRLQRRRLLQPLDRPSARSTTRRSCRRSSTSTGSARPRTASSSGPASARTAAC